MDDTTNLNPPAVVHDLARAAAVGFTISSDLLTGSLLRTLAASKLTLGELELTSAKLRNNQFMREANLLTYFQPVFRCRVGIPPGEFLSDLLSRWSAVAIFQPVFWLASFCADGNRDTCVQVSGKCLLHCLDDPLLFIPAQFGVNR